MNHSSLPFGQRVRRRLRHIAWRSILLYGMMLLSISTVLVAVLAWQIPYGSRLLLDPGEVASFNVVAPQRLIYESQVLLERARERAAVAVADQYDTQEVAVRRQQINAARTVLDAITAVRQDARATLAQKTDSLLAIAGLDLTVESAVALLSLTDVEWGSVVSETPLALDRVMRDEIRESTLVLVQRRVPMLISDSLTETAREAAIPLVQSLIRPNSVINVDRTNALRDQARAAVPPQVVTLERGEIVVRAGDVADAETAEQLREVSKLEHEWDLWTLLRAVLFAAALLLVTLAALFRLNPPLLRDQTRLAMLLVITVVWLVGAKLMVVNHPWLPFFYPLAALAILVGVLCTLRAALVIVVGFALVILYLSGGSAPVTAYATLASLTGVLVVGRGERLNSFLWAGLAITGVNMMVLSAFWLPFSGLGDPTPGEALLYALLNGVLSAAIALIGYFVLGNIFDIITPLQLTELSRPTHPLLRQLLLKASGTYHHTILVSNMAERAAAAIGADAMLVRVGAYYHDIGKTVRPYFFAENILDATSPHEKLDPLTSAQIIISHVKDGLDLAQKYHLPERIQDFIREHHGRSLVKYFYLQAQRQAGEAGEGETVNEEDFRYPGPNPRSKETSILLLADTCEAAVRAVRPATREAMEALVDRLIDERVMSGELDDSDLTFAELQTVRSVFLQVLQGVHHPRIVYPEPVRGEGRASGGGEGSPATGTDEAEPATNGSHGQRLGGVEEAPARLPETASLRAEG